MVARVEMDADHTYTYVEVRCGVSIAHLSS